jgi:hypothetical protein
MRSACEAEKADTLTSSFSKDSDLQKNFKTLMLLMLLMLLAKLCLQAFDV